MHLLFSAALLLSLLAPQKQLPDEFHQLPEELRAKATVVVTGTYGLGRSPCIFMPDGTRRWAMEAWFRIKHVYRGEVGGKYVDISTMWPKPDNGPVKFEVGHDYLVLLRPNEESMNAIKAGRHLPAWDAMTGEEIVAIVKLK